MSLKSEIPSYLDLSQMVSYYLLPNPKPISASGNGLLYTSEYFIVLNQLGETNGSGLDNYISVVTSCEVAKGFYKRAPNMTDISSYDDYIGIAAASEKYAKDIDNFNGSRVDPVTGTKIYLWRQPQVIAHIKMCGNKTLMPWWSLYWCLSVLFSSYSTSKSNQDGWMLSWLLVNSAEKSKTSNFLIKLVCKVWRSRYQKVWAEDIQGICARTIEAGHPVGKYFVY